MQELSAPSSPDQPVVVHTKPWEWKPSSLGLPLTSTAEIIGVELRFSYYNNGGSSK